LYLLACRSILTAAMKTGIIIVDHGSRLADSNRLLEEVAAAFAERYGQRYDIVEPAHMEIASPSIAEAYGKCVARGATEIVVVPYFLGPGKHWTHDIPRLIAEAAGGHPGVTFKLAGFLGLHELMLELLALRAEAAPGGHGTGRATASTAPGAATKKGE
jgi:sirohydrochlorin ferrochelatase